jgi:hypothetical protein
VISTAFSSKTVVTAPGGNGVPQGITAHPIFENQLAAINQNVPFVPTITPTTAIPTTAVPTVAPTTAAAQTQAPANSN